MGEVFLVQNPTLPRQEALKALDGALSRDDDFRARFSREADLLAGLSHPNIVMLLNRGEVGDLLWLTMEYVDGVDCANSSAAKDRCRWIWRPKSSPALRRRSTTPAYVPSYDSGTVSVIDTRTNTVTTTIPVGNAPWTPAITPNGNTANVANQFDGTVSVIDTGQ